MLEVSEGILTQDQPLWGKMPCIFILARIMFFNINHKKYLEQHSFNFKYLFVRGVLIFEYTYAYTYIHELKNFQDQLEK